MANLRPIMIIRKPSAKEIVRCYIKYASMEDWLPTRTTNAKDFAKELSKSDCYVKVAEDENGEISAFLYGNPEQMLHMPFPAYVQKYYCSWCKGSKAARALKMLHQDLFEFAEDRGYWMVISTGSHHDEKYSFTKMLERMLGWERRGYVAMQKTTHYDPEKAADGKSHQPRPTGRAARRLQQRGPQPPS